MTFKEIINAEVGNRANYESTQAPKWESTVKAVEEKLQKDYAREQYSSQEADLDTATDSVYDGVKRETEQEVIPYGQEGKPEDYASFIRRMHEGSRRVKQIGGIIFGYAPSHLLYASRTAEDTYRELKRLGIRCFLRNQYSSQKTDLDISNVEQKLKDDAQADIDKAFAAAVDSEVNNPTLSRKSLLIGYTPDILLKLGVPSLPMTFNNDHIYSCAKTKQEAIAEGFYDRRNNYHGLGASGVKKIYEVLKDPVAVIISKNPRTPSTPLRSTHSVVILVEIQGNKNSLLLPVKVTVQSRLGRLDVEVNEVSSAYDTDAAKYMRDAIWSEKTDGVGVFYITEKAKTLVNGGLQLPTKLQQALASSGGIVHQIPEKIKMAVSTNTQSVQFTNWFGDWQYESLTDEAKRRILIDAESTGDIQESKQIIEDLYGLWFAIEYTQTVYGTNERENRGRKRTNGTGSDRRYRAKSLFNLLSIWM